jgi:MFS family permease
MGDAVTNSTKKGWLTAILELGAWTGTIYSGVLAERISRKYTILVNVIIFCIGVIVQCTAVVGDSSYILGGRFVTGMGVGRYVSLEASPAYHRPLTRNLVSPCVYLCTTPK